MIAALQQAPWCCAALAVMFAVILAARIAVARFRSARRQVSLAALDEAIARSERARNEGST